MRHRGATLQTDVPGVRRVCACVRVCGCVCVRVCVWVCGCVGVWVCAYMHVCMHTCMHVCGGHRCPDALSAGTTMPARPRWTSTNSTSSDTRAGRRSSARPGLSLSFAFPRPPARPGRAWQRPLRVPKPIPRPSTPQPAHCAAAPIPRRDGLLLRDASAASRGQSGAARRRGGALRGTLLPRRIVPRRHRSRF